jgi:hypothetical protein
MKLSQLAAKPQLIKITLDDQSIVTQYGEAIEFYTWDRQPLEVFMKLANQSQSEAGSGIIDIIKTLILNDDGTEVIQGDNMLPTDVLMAAITKLTASLGK